MVVLNPDIAKYPHNDINIYDWFKKRTIDILNEYDLKFERFTYHFERGQDAIGDKITITTKVSFVVLGRVDEIIICSFYPIIFRLKDPALYLRKVCNIFEKKLRRVIEKHIFYAMNRDFYEDD